MDLGSLCTSRKEEAGTVKMHAVEEREGWEYKQSLVVVVRGAQGSRCSQTDSGSPPVQEEEEEGALKSEVVGKRGEWKWAAVASSGLWQEELRSLVQNEQGGGSREWQGSAEKGRQGTEQADQSVTELQQELKEQHDGRKGDLGGFSGNFLWGKRPRKSHKGQRDKLTWNFGEWLIVECEEEMNGLQGVEGWGCNLQGEAEDQTLPASSAHTAHAEARLGLTPSTLADVPWC